MTDHLTIGDATADATPPHGIAIDAGVEVEAETTLVEAEAASVVRDPRRQPARVAVWALAIVGGLAMWCALYALVLSPIQAHRSQRNLYATIRAQLALQTVPVEAPIHNGTAIAVMDIDAIGVRDLVVVEGTSPSDLQDGPGHRRDTPLPGQTGVSVVMGRSDLFGGPFERIAELGIGDIVTVTTGQGSFRYSVDAVRRPGDPGTQPVTAPAGRLTLITSEGVGSGLDASRRIVYVDATLLGPGLPAAADRPTSVAADETTLRGDGGSLGALAGWLAALIATLVAADALQSRWGRRQVLIVCSPVVIALLWLAAETASHLLPNVM